MSKRSKIIFIIGGAAAFLLVGLLAVVSFAYWLINEGGTRESRMEGTKFGKTTDYAGCQAEGISRVRNLGFFEIMEGVRVEYFVEGCLETSRPSADFCKGLPTEMQDIRADDGWKREECRKLGWTDMSADCRGVLRVRLEFCEKR